MCKEVNIGEIYTLVNLVINMRDNIRHAITVGECSMVVENAHLNNEGLWLSSFQRSLNRDNYSIYRLCYTVMNRDHHPTPQGEAYWDAFRRLGRD